MGLIPIPFYLNEPKSIYFNSKNEPRSTIYEKALISGLGLILHLLYLE